MKKIIVLGAFLFFFFFFACSVKAFIAPFGYHAPYNQFGDCQDFYFDDQQLDSLNFIKSNENYLHWQISRFAGSAAFAYWLVTGVNTGWDYLDQRFAKTSTEILVNINCKEVDIALDQNLCNQYIESILKRYDGDCDANDNGNCQDKICQHSLSQSTTDCTEEEKISENTNIIYPQIKYFQISNEPYSPNSAWFNDPQGYANHFVNTSQLIKSRCPTCKVALGGMTDAFSFVKTVLQQIGANNAHLMDFFDFHYFRLVDMPLGGEKWLDLKTQKNNYQNLLNQYGFSNSEIIVTEMSYYPSQGTESEKDLFQAKELPKYYVYGLTHGINSLFWGPFLIEDDSLSSDIDFQFAGLIRPRNVSGRIICDNQGRKPAFYAYKTMTDNLSGFTNYSIEQETNETYIYKFIFPPKMAKIVFVVWTGDGLQKTFNLSNYFGSINLPQGEIQTIFQTQPESFDSFEITIDDIPRFIAIDTSSIHCQPLGDIDCSTRVSILDMAYLVSRFGSTDFLANLDDYNQVNSLDFSLLLSKLEYPEFFEFEDRE